VNTPKIRVLIVDDSFFMRKVITDFLHSDPAIEVVGQAADGAEALQRIAELHPQVVTLDIEMPVMNGLETLKAIVSAPRYPSVVMVSGYVQPGADITLQCLAMGAADFVLKPSGSFSLDMDKVKEVLIKKVKDAAEVDTTKAHAALPPAPKTWHFRKTGGVVIIGASTGGPAALELLLPTFPKNFPCPIVVAQHLPKEFTVSFADRLDKHCPLRAVRAEQNMPLTVGTIFIAPGGSITTISQAAGRPELHLQNSQALETPSINQLMTSAAAIYGDQTIGIILTGMGKDGAEGMAHVKQVGGHTVVQDESTSAVFGMGGEVVARGLADVVVPLGRIMEKVNELLV
jgi:two-component system, chemotaxis family, protein-glutamate methylesterase/glutaminase